MKTNQVRTLKTNVLFSSIPIATEFLEEKEMATFLKIA
jgi:hypothetical protein